MLFSLRKTIQVFLFIAVELVVTFLKAFFYRQAEDILKEEVEGFAQLHSQLVDLAPAIAQLHRRYSFR